MTENTSGTLRAPVWIDPDVTLEAAAAHMAEAGTSSVLVGRPGELASILTERDVARAVARGDAPATRVGDLAVPEPVNVPIESTVRDAAELMLSANVRHLVVQRSGTAVGVVSMRDVLQALLDSTHPTLVVAMASFGPDVHAEHWWG